MVESVIRLKYNYHENKLKGKILGGKHDKSNEYQSSYTRSLCGK